MKKNARQEQICKLIDAHVIETQEELAAYLLSSGFRVTQATVSRDIRELRLRKVQGPDGRWRYAAEKPEDPERLFRAQRVLREAYVSMASSANILVIHTVSGMAMAAAASLDALEWPELLGSIAGDDTVFAVLRSERDAADVMDKLQKMAEVRSPADNRRV